MLWTKRRLGRLLLCVVILGSGPVARSLAFQPTTSINATALPYITDCESMHGWSGEWSPTFIEPDFSISDSYQCDGYRLHVSVVQYVEQHQGKEAVGEFNSVIPRTWWNVTTRGRQRVTPALEVDVYRVDLSPVQLTIWNWYAVGLRTTSSEFATKALEALNALTLRSLPTTNITVAVEADPGFDTATVLPNDTKAIWAWFEAEMRING